MAPEFTVLRRVLAEEEFVDVIGSIREQAALVLRYYGLDAELADDVADAVLRNVSGDGVDERWADAGETARRGYIHKTIRSRVVDLVRREARSVRYEPERWDRVPGDDVNPEEELQWAETLHLLGLPHWPRHGSPPPGAIEVLLASVDLSDAERAVLRGYVDGLSHDRIAERCGRAVDSVEARKRAVSWSTTTLSRAASRMRTWVAKASSRGGAK